MKYVKTIFTSIIWLVLGFEIGFFSAWKLTFEIMTNRKPKRERNSRVSYKSYYDAY